MSDFLHGAFEQIKFEASAGNGRSSDASSLRAWRSRLLGLICGIAFVGSAICLLISVFCLARGWRDTTIPEGSVVYSVCAVFGADSVYRDYHVPPYATTPYGPLYYVLVAMVQQLFGGGIEGAYLAGRSISFVSFLAAVGLFFFVAVRRVDFVFALAIATAVCTVTCMDGWLATTRPDVVGAFLSLAGVCCVTTKRSGALYAAAAMFAAAILLKLSFVSGPLAATWWLALRRSKTSSSLLATSTAAFVAVGYLAAYLVWGEALLKNLVQANQAPLAMNLPMVLQISMLKCAFILCIVAGIAIASYWSRKRGQPIEVWYFLISLLVAEISSLKGGADINYFIEPVFAAGLVTARAAWRIRYWACSSKFRFVVSLVSLIVLLQIGFVFRLATTLSVARPLASPPQELLDWVKQERPLIGSADLAVRAGYPPQILDLFNASYLSDSEGMRFDALRDAIERGEIDSIITNTPLETQLYDLYFWPAPIREEILRHFDRLRGRYHGYFRYAKRNNPGK